MGVTNAAAAAAAAAVQNAVRTPPALWQYPGKWTLHFFSLLIKRFFIASNFALCSLFFDLGWRPPELVRERRRHAPFSRSTCFFFNDFLSLPWRDFRHGRNTINTQGETNKRDKKVLAAFPESSLQLKPRSVPRIL